MNRIRAAIGTMAVLAFAAPARAEYSSGRVRDPANASFAASAVLTPSGTAGTAGTIGGTAASSTNTGRSFGWNCTSSGLGTVTLVDGSIRQVWMYANNGADVRGDAFAIIDAEPPSSVPCTFQVYR